MNFNIEDILYSIQLFLLILFRCASMIMSMPVMGAQMVPLRIKIFVSVALTLMIFPLVQLPEKFDLISPLGFLIISQQILIGILIGFSLQIVFQIFIFAGQIISTQSGLSFASLVDPTNGVSIPLLGQLYMLIINILFLVTNSHLILINLLIKSYHLIPAGYVSLDSHHFLKFVELGSIVFYGGVLVSFPIIVGLLFLNVIFAVVTRAAPQFNLFNMGFPITILFGFLLLYLTLPDISDYFKDFIETDFQLIQSLAIKR